MTESRIRRIKARWQAFQPTRTGSFWAVVYTTAAVLVLGFTAGGWMTAGSAQEMADKAAAQARAQLASTLCVERFLASEDAGAQLAEFKDIDFSFKRREYVQEGGWASMPGDTPASMQATANACAAALYKHTGAVAEGTEKAEG